MPDQTTPKTFFSAVDTAASSAVKARQKRNTNAIKNSYKAPPASSYSFSDPLAGLDVQAELKAPRKRVGDTFIKRPSGKTPEIWRKGMGLDYEAGPSSFTGALSQLADTIHQTPSGTPLDVLASRQFLVDGGEPTKIDTAIHDSTSTPGFMARWDMAKYGYVTKGNVQDPEREAVRKRAMDFMESRGMTSLHPGFVEEELRKAVAA